MTSINFYKPISFIDKIICFFSRGKYCHVNITTFDNVTYEAIPFSKVHKFNNELPDNVDSFILNL